MIDLHTHSTASDGTDSPTELVAAAHAAGVTTLAAVLVGPGVAAEDTAARTERPPR